MGSSAGFYFPLIPLVGALASNCAPTAPFREGPLAQVFQRAQLHIQKIFPRAFLQPLGLL
jgi:hypothetical protein